MSFKRRSVGGISRRKRKKAEDTGGEEDKSTLYT
jgi:hypothetical protein